MEFDPINKEIYTDKGEFIKKLDCPYRLHWDQLDVIDTTSRKCTYCDHFILDTKFITDDELMAMVKNNPKTCVKIDLNQHNIKVLSNGLYESK